MAEFCGVDLEDSRVLGWQFQDPPGRMVIQLRVRVVPENPLQPAQPTDRAAEIVFETISHITGLIPPMAISQPEDEPPRIDTLAYLCRDRDGSYTFDASWGAIRVYCDDVHLRFHDETRAAA